MRNQRNQRYATLRMSAAICIVMGVGMNVGMDNGCAADNVQMRKKVSNCVVTYEKRYEKQ